MAHIHSVYDTDLHFVIDPTTRAIKNQSTKSRVIQYDHNSERATFEIPRFVEGHDMTLCDKVEIHYTNGKNKDIYIVGDVGVSPATDDIVIFSWLLSRNATQYEGALEFVIKFTCLTDDTIDYEWNTAICTEIKIAKGLSNTEMMTELYADFLATWKKEIDDQLDEINAKLAAVVEGSQQ